MGFNDNLEYLHNDSPGYAQGKIREQAALESKINADAKKEMFGNEAEYLDDDMGDK